MTGSQGEPLGFSPCFPYPQWRPRGLGANGPDDGHASNHIRITSAAQERHYPWQLKHQCRGSLISLREPCGRARTRQRAKTRPADLQFRRRRTAPQSYRLHSIFGRQGVKHCQRSFQSEGFSPAGANKSFGRRTTFSGQERGHWRSA